MQGERTSGSTMLMSIAPPSPPLPPPASPARPSRRRAPRDSTRLPPLPAASAAAPAAARSGAGAGRAGIQNPAREEKPTPVPCDARSQPSCARARVCRLWR